MSKGETVQAMKKPAVKAAMNCVGRPVYDVEEKREGENVTVTKYQECLAKQPMLKMFQLRTSWTSPKRQKKKAQRNVRTVGEVSGLDDHALALVIDAHLSAVQNHRAHHVRVDAAVEARNACVGESEGWWLFGIDLLI